MLFLTDYIGAYARCCQYSGECGDMGEVAIARWQANVLLDLRAADLYETKLRYICDMTKGMGKIFFEGGGSREMLNG